MKLKERKQNSGLLLKLIIALIFATLILVLILFSRSPQAVLVSSKQVTDFTPHKLELQIPEVNFKQIKAKRAEALQKGLLFSSSEDMVDGSLRHNAITIPMRLRLKGDLLDHIQGDKWSYRIKLKNNQQWNEMNTFSIHSSGARSHMAEWLMLQLFRQEGIITPNYDFIQVEENGDSKGVYAYEQFFDNSLLEQNKQPIGPILKHADDAYWENVQKNITPFHWTKMADLELMNTENKNDPAFLKAFQQAKSKLQAYLNGEAKLIDVFDVEKLAKYYALMEISHAYHAQQITNIRFYYNPLTAKLEPIGFDCFGTSLPVVTQEWTGAAEGQNKYSNPRKDYPYGGVYLHKLFQDKVMTAHYLKYLHQYSSDEFLDKIKSDWDSAVQQRVNFIQSDEAYKDYTFSYEDLFKKAKWTREKILPLPSYSLNVEVLDGTRKQLVCSSYHYFPMELIGLGNEQMEQTFKKPVYLEAYDSKNMADSKVIQNPNNYRQVYFRTLGIDSIFTEEINRLSFAPQTPIIQTGDLSFIDDNECIKLTGTHIEFGPCPVILDRTVVIPKGHTISIKPGTVIQLKSSANLISFSPIQANGSEAEIIRIEGRQNNGLMLSDVSGQSQFNHIVLNNLGSIYEAEFQTNAAMTVYNSKVNFNAVTVSNSESKNALLLQNTSFNISDLNVIDSPGTGIAIAYSTGKINQLDVTDVNVDGVQVYDSSLQLTNATFEFVKGTAFNVNRSPSMTLSKIDIDNSYRAFKISDSSVNVDVVDINDVEEGIYATNQNEASNVAFTNGNMIDVQYPYLLGGDDFFFWNGSKKRAK